MKTPPRMGCGASNAGGGGASGGTKSEARHKGSSARDAVAAYVQVFLTQPIFHAQVQSALRADTAKEPAEKQASLAALDTIRSKLADFCDVSGAAERSAFNAKLRATLSDEQCEAFAALRLDPVKLAHVTMETLRANPTCFPIYLNSLFDKLAACPGGLEELELPSPPPSQGSDTPMDQAEVQTPPLFRSFRERLSAPFSGFISEADSRTESPALSD